MLGEHWRVMTGTRHVSVYVRAVCGLESKEDEPGSPRSHVILMRRAGASQTLRNLQEKSVSSLLAPP